MPPPDPSGLGPTSMGMAPNVAAGCSYILTWITGLIFFLSEKQNKFVRFHAMQAILLGVLNAIVGVIYMFIMMGAAAASMSSATASVASVGMMGIIFMIVWIGFFALWVVCLIMGFTGKWFKIPVLGDLAMKWST
jgi:uncharacterized membrane protein